MAQPEDTCLSHHFFCKDIQISLHYVDAKEDGWGKSLLANISQKDCGSPFVEGLPVEEWIKKKKKVCRLNFTRKGLGSRGQVEAGFSISNSMQRKTPQDPAMNQQMHIQSLDTCHAEEALSCLWIRDSNNLQKGISELLHLKKVSVTRSHISCLKFCG